MFDRLKKAFKRDADSKLPAEGTPSQMSPGGPVSEWASAHGLSFSQGAGKAVAMQGKVGGQPWRMEIGRPSRNYIMGEELRARADLGLTEDVAAMVINRPLKDALEKKAYSMITDTLQTTADPNLPEEMRWLAMYDEVGWEGPPAGFWKRYAVLADRKEHALAWVDDSLADRLMGWPPGGPGAEIPFVLVMMRGKCYLRMEYVPPETSTLQHASEIFICACQGAMGSFPRG